MRLLRILVCLALIILFFAGGCLMVLQKRYLPLLKPGLENRMSKALHADASIESLGLTFLPDPAIRLSGLLIAMPPECGHLASVKSAYLRFSGRALLSGQLSGERMIISEPAVYITLKHGQLVTNGGGACEAKAAPSAAPALPANQSTRTTRESGRATLPPWLSLRIKLIELERGTFHFTRDNFKLNLDAVNGRASVAFDGGNAEIKDLSLRGELLREPLSLDLPLLRWNSATGLTAGPTSLGLGTSKLVLEGSFDQSLDLKNIKISSTGLNLGTVEQIAPGFVPRSQGQLAFDLSLAKEETGDMLLSGDVNLEKLYLASPELRLERGAVNGLEVLVKEVGPVRIKGKTNLKQFGLEDGGDRYGVNSFDGAFVYEGSGPIQTIQGNADVKGFSFSDGLTSVFDVNAVLSKITTRLDKRKGVDVTLSLNGSSVQLTHPVITISGAKRVESPLTISVPKGGGYSVAGPVSVDSASVDLWKRPLSKVSGHLDMLVSSPLKRFASQDLSGLHEGIAIGAGTTFSMTKEAYSLSPTTLRLNAGSLGAQGEMRRSPQTSFQASTTASNVSIPDMVRIAAPGSTETFEGTLTSFTGTLSGDRNDFERTANGAGSFSIEQPLVKGFDLGRSLAKAMSRVPVLSGKIVPEGLKDDPRQISSRASFKIEKGKINLSPLKLKRRNYSVEGSLDIGFDMTLDGQADVIFLQQTLKELGHGYDLLARIMRKRALVSFPILIKGKIPDVDIQPNLTEFAKRASGLSLAQSAIGGAIGLGRKGAELITSPFRGDSSSSSSTSSAASPSS